MNSENPMVREVDKIIANLLVAEGAVCIPEVGCLRVVRRAAKRVSARMIEPPFRAVEFSSQGEATSLADAIARAAGCTEEQGQEICRRWIEQVSNDGALTIGGVGVLRDKAFTVDPLFDQRLNPHGHEPVAVRRRRGHGPLWALAAVAVVCGVGACCWILLDRSGRYETPITVVIDQPAAVAESEVAVADTTSQMAPDAPQVTQNNAETASLASDAPASIPATKLVPAKPVASSEVLQFVSGRTYVVWGVYSTIENARRAIRESTRTESAFEGKVYRYGSKFMVSIHESDDANEARTFMRRYQAQYPDMWTYRAK